MAGKTSFRKTGNNTSKKKVKRWRKGHASDSNPETKKHREAAKNRFFSVDTGKSSLTVEALAKHDEGAADAASIESAMDTLSVGGKTFNTWATNWTDCTNATFNKVHRYWASNSAMHKEILAVLAAVTEVIKAQGGKETETEYFGALMTALESVEGENSVAAVVYLLSLAMKRVPESVLRTKFSTVSKTLLELLGNYADSSTASLIKSLVQCLTTLLRVQEQAAWSNSSTMQVYQSLLLFVIHTKPKVRKSAQQAIRVILKASGFMLGDKAPAYHPAAATTGKFCVQQIEECGGIGEASTTLHILGLLEHILGIFPQSTLKSCCETILKVMTLSNVMITSVAMKALYGMFLLKPKQSSLGADLNAQIITALYDYQPSENDPQPMSAWLAVMQSAHINLMGLNESLCLGHLPRIFTACMKCLQSDKPQMSAAASKTLINLLKECVSLARDRIQAEMTSDAGGATAVHKMFRAVEGGLSYQYHAAWNLVLHVLQVFYEVLGKICHKFMTKSLLSMADLRDSHQFPYKTELDRAFGEAVSVMGPAIVLQAVPLNITGNEDNYDFPRSWILPVLRDHVKETEIAHFTTYFLPLAAKLHSKAEEFESKGRVVESKTYNALQYQMWSLLPGFCTRPTDLQTSFKGIAKILGTALSDREELRMDVLSSIRKVVQHSLNNDEDKAEIGRFSKNFMPIFLNLFTSEPTNKKDSTRLAVLETIKSYLQITDTQLMYSLFDKCLSKMEDAETTTFRKHALLDVCIAMVTYIDTKRLSKLFPLVVKQLRDTDRTVQKKSYRVLEEMCKGESDMYRNFVKSHLDQLQEQLLKSLSSSSPQAKAPRLRCLIHILRQLEEANMEFIQAVIPEAILCTREVAEKARGAAYLLLKEMGESLQRWLPDMEKEEVVKLYIEMILAGLAGSPQMVTCTVLALSSVLFTYKDAVSSGVLQTVVDGTCLLLKSKAREIVTAALGLLKVVLVGFPVTTTAQFLQQIVASLVTMKEDNRIHLRFKTKDIFKRLIKKFGYDQIIGMVPKSLHKLLVNIKKTQERAKRQKDKDEDDDSGDEGDDGFKKQKPETIDDLLQDSDSDLDDEGTKGKKGKKPKTAGAGGKKGAAWLQEGAEGSIVDFLDPSVSKKVLTTKPANEGEKRYSSVQHDFKFAPDGRIIIAEDSDDENAKDDVMLEADELQEAFDMRAGKKKLKRKIGQTDMDDDEDGEMKYKPGGSGIHRPLAKAKKVKRDVQPGEEYKAKRAHGDVKRKGAPDPYAYVPLDYRNLNKRKGKKNAGRFNNLVKGAKKGAMKGSKKGAKARQGKR